MKIAELHHITLDILKQLNKSFINNKQSPQFQLEMTLVNIAKKVAFQALKTGVWQPSPPLSKADEDIAGTNFPAIDVSGIRSVLWQFVGLGILVPTSLNPSQQEVFEITRYGEKVLTEIEESPYDPYGFLMNLHTHSPNLEPESFSFIEEAVDCFLGRYLRASVVMIGLTAENEIYKTIELYRDTLEAEKRQKFNKNISSKMFIKQKFDILVQHLKGIKNDLPEGIRELDLWFYGIYQTIRMSRNEAGHPIGINHSVDDVFSTLISFRIFANKLSLLKEYLITESNIKGNNHNQE